MAVPEGGRGSGIRISLEGFYLDWENVNSMGQGRDLRSRELRGNSVLKSNYLEGMIHQLIVFYKALFPTEVVTE
jgi:hypothetical protein